MHSEFRDGNVPAGHDQLRVLRESLEYLPAGVEQVLLRSDTAGYQWELLRYCAEGRDERFGVIEFAVGVDVTPEFREAVAEVDDDQWHELYRQTEDGRRVHTGQQYAEVCYVPNSIGHSKNGPEYRFIAIREILRRPTLPGMEDSSVRTVQMSDGGWYKVTGVVTNRDLAGDELIGWYRQRCGKGEEVHGVVKDDLAGGRLPSGRFGANTAWWAIVVLAFNPVSEYGAGSELGDEAVGPGRRLEEEASESGTLRDHLSTGTSGAARQETDHSSGARTPFL